MNARMTAGLVSLLVVAGLLVPGATLAGGGTVAVENLRGPLVNAWFSAIDPGGCIVTDTFVTANRPTDQQLPGAGTTTGIAAVDVYRYDACTGDGLLQLNGETDALALGDFWVSNQLDQARLHTTIAATNLDSGAMVSLAIDVSFVGTSAITRNHSNTNEVYPGCHVLNRWKGSGRQATASGTVSDGATSFVPSQSDAAEIGFVIDGFEVIGCA